MDTQTNPNRRFGGIERLYGTASWQKLQQAHVTIVGVGGVGSWVVEALARSGVGQLTLIDLDNVAESNTNRQLPAVTPLFGMPKVEALKQRVFDINPECQVHIIEDFVDEDNISTLFAQNVDFVVDAIDQVRVKAAMAAWFVRHKQAFIVSGAAGGQRHPEHIRVADLSAVKNDKLLSNLRYTLRKRHGFSRDTDKKMKVPCVYSLETVMPPQNDGACDLNGSQGLSCAGYGASMLVTASVGLQCAHAAIEHIVSASQ
ncbi:tRNA threonylcarbamoyladenosine dehydratase [Vitreoscilla stercoraria]|uniref:tRNA threonylcarbamoyladenosine dehydratase n=1 Tax=Vitreoscilla stercoraria TaxID=61 RepID=A0ABY4EDH1_VITST|nr:tRNA threonylcarbamoyladenosine dehydratase [Vitreoscilla stercoraria]UOO92703.1 tRNA threonylcarbamoyladenosine dehydratase [Vitreoscilla stercoraria]